MKYATSVYIFRQAKKAKTRFNLISLNGLDLIPTSVLKRGPETGQRYLSVQPTFKKKKEGEPDESLWYKPEKKLKKLTGMFFPALIESQENWKGYGDINPLDDEKRGQDAILIDWDKTKGIIKIAVYPGLGDQSSKVYEWWISGQVIFGLDNKTLL